MGLVSRTEREFGSKRGFAYYIFWRTSIVCGFYQAGSDIVWNRVGRVIFLCTGNICRSPLAAAKARALGLDALSAGIRCRRGINPDPRTLAFAAKHALAGLHDGTTPLGDITLTDTDLVIGMEPMHLYADQVRQADCQRSLLGSWLAHPRAYLHDPYSADVAYFERCGELILSAVTSLARAAHSKGYVPSDAI
jgi:protein-tyrosine phosphatase